MLISLPGLIVVREELLLTQAEVAAKAKMAPETISRIESGRPVRQSSAKALAEALDVNVERLLLRKGKR